ncbi:MAG: HEAT repeat domain-containing protein [Methanobrevibacter sp.]|jgi:HEAT repeat protein|nr:HEAT repeat domain-containing protein [Candidatus Methanovirga basalitermitum]
MAKNINELISDLDNDNEFIQEESKTLLEKKGAEAVEPLVDALLNNKNKDIKILAAKILGNIGDKKAINPLIATLSNPNKMVRREASTSLIKMGNDAVEPLITVLENEDWRIRGAASWVLGSIGDKRAVEPLKALLNDESGYVKSGAKKSLDTLEKIS